MESTKQVNNSIKLVVLAKINFVWQRNFWSSAETEQIMAMYRDYIRRRDVPRLSQCTWAIPGRTQLQIRIRDKLRTIIRRAQKDDKKGQINVVRRALKDDNQAL